MKAIPKTLATGSNNPSKQVSVNVWNNGHNVHGMTRAELQALTPTAGQIGYCKESGREGEFVWDSSDHSANVTRDTAQGLYIPPASDTTGASGAWVRKYSGFVNVKWFGAVADDSTDAYAAIAAALSALPDTGGTLYIPEGQYRVSSTIHVTKPIRIQGDGIGQNPGIIDGVSYSGVDIHHGTILHFDAGVEGIVFHPHTTVDNPVTVLADINAHYTERSAVYSEIRDLTLLSGSRSMPAYSAGKNGLRTKTIIRAENVWILAFADNGVEISATPSDSDPTINYGNADMAQFKGVVVNLCANDGFHLEGGDAQVCTFIGCNSSTNGGWGFNDEGFLGNVYIGCHVMGNNQTNRASADSQVGSFRCSNVNGASIYLGCYIENPTIGEICDLSPPCVVIGGIMASSRYYASTNQALVINGTGGVAGVMGYRNATGDTQVSAGLGGHTAATPANVAMWFGCAEESAGLNDWRLKYNSTTNTWGLEFALGGTSTMPYQLASQGSNWRTSTIYAPSFPQGIFLGPDGGGPRIFYGTTAPSSGNWIVGDVVLNSGPATGEGAGWICTAAGAPGTWVEFGRIANQGAAIADLTTTATSGTLPTADGSVTIANAASPTVTELLEYCVELEAKLETLLARVRAHGMIAT